MLRTGLSKGRSFLADLAKEMRPFDKLRASGVGVQGLRDCPIASHRSKLGGMISIPTIETARFRLRGPTMADFEPYAAMWADERTTRFIGAGGKARSRTESWGKYLAMPGLWHFMGYGYWVFTERDSDAYVGCGGLSWFDRGIDQLVGYPESGWAIAPDWWGKGAASEIMAAALSWADGALEASEIRCIINPGNGASEAVAAKLGFGLIGSSDALGDPVNVYSRVRGG